MGDIFLKKSDDAGLSFGGAENLSNNTGLSTDPSIKAFDKDVYIVWKDNSTGVSRTSSDVYLMKK